MRFNKVRNKKGQQNGLMGGIALVVLILAGLVFAKELVPGIFSGLSTDKDGNTITDQKVTVKLDTAGVNTCGISPTLTVGPAFNKGDGTALSDAYHRVLVGDEKVGALYADSATLSPGAGQKVQVYYNFNSTKYYTSVGAQFVMPCSDTRSSNNNAGDNAEGWTNVTPSVTLFNDVGDAMPTSGNQSISAGEARTVKVELRGTAKRAFSPNGPINLICSYNATAFQDLTISQSIGDGKILRQYSPKRGSFASDTTKAFLLQGSNAGSGIIGSEVVTFNVQALADSTNGGGIDDVSCTGFDADYFLRSNSPIQIEKGYETDTGGDVGTTDFNFTIHYT